MEKARFINLRSVFLVFNDNRLCGHMPLSSQIGYFNTFKTVTTQKDPQPTFQQFKVSLRAFEESEHSSVKAESVMKVEAPGMSKRSHQITCYLCKKIGHKAYECKQKRGGVLYASLEVMTQKCAERKVIQ